MNKSDEHLWVFVEKNLKAFVLLQILETSFVQVLFKEMNNASREKDQSKIEMYGPLASALGYIIHCGNFIDSRLSKTF